MATVVTQQMLDEAQSAYHSLMIGQGVAEVRDQNGEVVRYSRSDVNKLANYIAWLKAELGITTTAVGPMRVWM